MIRRRKFIVGLGSAAALPLAAVAQQRPRIRRIGVLMARAESDPFYQAYLQIFRTRLQQLGWTDGDNLRIDYRWTVGIADRFRSAAAELVALKPDVLLADATPSVAALRRETQIIPIVFATVTDPVAQGFVASLAQPGNQITGFTNNEFSMGGKWLSLLKDAAPTIRRVALMFNPTTAPYADSFSQVIEAAVPSYGLVSIRMPIQSAGEIESGVAAFAHEPNGALLLLSDSFLMVHRDRLVALAMQHRLPTIYDGQQWSRSGGLISYGADASEMYRGAASYVDRILRGAKPNDLPVQAPTKFILSINLKTAKALGLAVSDAFLLAADEVIE